MIKPTLKWDKPPTRGIASVAAVPREVADAMNSAMRETAEEMEAWAKQNHPWTNRTGKAEGGLTGYHGAYGGALTEPGEVTHYAAVKHGDDVDYGIWLEVKYGGKWGVIQRTIEAFSAVVSERVTAALNGLA